MPAPTRVRKRNPRYQDEDDEEEENPRQRSRSLAFGMSDSNIRDDPDEQQNNINNYNDDDASHTAVQDQSNDREEFHDDDEDNNEDEENGVGASMDEDHPDDNTEQAHGDTTRQGTQSTPLPATMLTTPTRTTGGNPAPQPPATTAIPPNAIGLEAAIKRTYPQGVPEDIITSELDWQAAVKGDALAIKNFRSEVLIQQGLVVFAFMQPDNTTMSLLHSPATYMARGAEGSLKGKDIGFVGDRLPFSTPIPILLQKEKPWKWTTVGADLNEASFLAFYSNQANHNKLYTPPPNEPLTNVLLPRLVLIPSNFIPYCAATPRTPGQLFCEISNELAVNTTIAPGTYRLLMDWCMAASHAANGSSIITYSLEAAHSNSPTYLNWISLRLNATLGQQVMPAAAPTPPPPTFSNTSTLATLAAEFGKGVLQAIQPAGTATTTTAIGPIQGTTPAAGKTYDQYQYAVIQGFSNCPTQAGLQPIWGLFTQTKNVDSVRLHIKAAMKRWATRHCVNIHNGLLLSKPTIEAIRDVIFNPGGGVAYFASAEKGISILTCQPESGEKRDATRATEIAQEISNTNRTLAEALELGKNDPRPPPGTYQDLKATVGTFCGLLHTLFGPGCDYYVKCFEVYACLNSDTVEENAHHFDPLYCRQIIWAILDSGREYFNKPMLPDAFLVPPGTPIAYPISELDEFTRLIKQQTPIIKKNFPTQWLPRQDRADARTKTQAGSGGQARATVPSVISGAASTASTRTGASSLTGTTSAPTPTIRQSNIHPKIKTVMGKYMTRIGRLQISRIMAVARITWTDMPTLPAFLDGTTNKLCYNYVLGKCNPRYCTHRTGHATESDITDDFAEKLCTILQPGLEDMTPELAKCTWTEFKANIDSRNRTSE